MYVQPLILCVGAEIIYQMNQCLEHLNEPELQLEVTNHQLTIFLKPVKFLDDVFPFISISLGVFGCCRIIYSIPSSGSLYDTWQPY